MEPKAPGDDQEPSQAKKETFAPPPDNKPSASKAEAGNPDLKSNAVLPAKASSEDARMTTAGHYSGP